MSAARLLPVEVGTYRPHAMHTTDRVWTETNCSLDVWIEVLHSLGLDPVPAGAVALSADFQSDQWVFLKYPLEDLRALYGITVDEMNVWRPLLDHLDEQFAAGRLLTIEADSWFLPDTDGVAYRRAHQKSTIVPNLIDRDAQRMEYFHNAGYWELSGADFDGVFRLDEPSGSALLPPYVELVGLEQVRVDRDVVEVACGLARAHLSRRPADNPVTRLGARLGRDLDWLTRQDLEMFHVYAFGVVRQCGVTAEIAAEFLTWLTDHGEQGLTDAAEAFSTVATQTKSLQFQLARAARGRSVTFDQTLQTMTDTWQAAVDGVAAWAG
jgi:hypothetical protein